METAVQRVWRIKSKRSFMGRLVVYWLLMFLGPLFLAIALGFLGSKDLGLIDILPKRALALSFCFFAFASIYKFVPARPVSWRSSLISAFIATIAIGVVQGFYGQVTRKVLSYNKVYGSLASIPIFLLWVLVLWWVCLAGVALCAAIEKEIEESNKSPIQIPSRSFSDDPTVSPSSGPSEVKEL